MIAYEFEAEIKDGFIKIPHDFKGCLPPSLHKHQINPSNQIPAQEILSIVQPFLYIRFVQVF